MTTYTAYFRTDADFATQEFEADTPEQALAQARTFCEDHTEELVFCMARKTLLRESSISYAHVAHRG